MARVRRLLRSGAVGSRVTWARRRAPFPSGLAAFILSSFHAGCLDRMTALFFGVALLATLFGALADTRRGLLELEPREFFRGCAL
jgi:hypothetical protein